LSALAQVGGIPGGPTPDQAAIEADAARRLELAESILDAREAASGRSFDPGYRAILKSRLASATVEQLEANRPQLLTPGDSDADLVYTPVTPCRVFDTRSATAGILVGGSQRNFVVAGSTGFPTQGGLTGGCGVPLGRATGVIINFAAVNPAGPGNLRAWAVATPQPGPPNAVVMNYNPVMPALANGIAVPICDTSATSCPFDLRLQADVSSTHVVGDVVGYFARLSAPRTTQITYSGQTDATPVPGAPVVFRDLGTFNKTLAASEIHASWQGHVRQTGTPGSTFCNYQLRIDGALPVGITSPNSAGAAHYSGDSLGTLTGRWRGLATGVHTVSLWLRGTATTCTLNFGNFQQVVEVVEQ
jgi:hypothetical protein